MTTVADHSQAGRKAFALPAAEGLDIAAIRAEFPILSREVNGRKLVYLDNGATSQKPRAVIRALSRYYEEENANIHRGVHLLSIEATEAHDSARRAAQRFLNAARESEIVFVRGTTEAINLVAQTCGRARVAEGDEVLITAMEHHSNIVPWQMLCEEKGARLRVAPINDRGELLMEEFQKLVGPRTRFVAVTHVSNALGTLNPVKEMVAIAHGRGVPVLVDGAQAVSHLAVDVQDLDCDFYAFSGHKVYGPTGIGVLYGKYALLDAMPPYQGGGDMISSVTFEKTTFKKPPSKFEAGTPDIAGAIGLGVALDYLTALGIDRVAAHEHDLLDYATGRIGSIRGVRLIGTAARRAGVLSFIHEDIHPHDLGTILDNEGIAVRAGHHCAQPVMERFSVPATARASFAVYNTREEIDVLARGIEKAERVFGR
jgi:cysteine desulfurase / selenocysteine lyase